MTKKGIIVRGSFIQLESWTGTSMILFTHLGYITTIAATFIIKSIDYTPNEYFSP